ncbi:hypothetical protein Ahy_B07g088825 isoform C [Arachis hypogaea]|nr:hypothetical protein Ahy_B07g088825 isoform C [Arachis hypogaea]
MVRRWTKYLGQEETIKLMKWNNSEPSFSLRQVNIANQARGFSRDDLVMQLNALKVPYSVSPHLDEFVRVKTGLQTVIHAGLLRKGLCSVQDESAGLVFIFSCSRLYLVRDETHRLMISGLVVSIVDPQPGETVIDCCAAPGGKTLYMASRLCGQGKLLLLLNPLYILVRTMVAITEF